ncbi:MAG: HAMP domain-containing histidine kinase [Bacteroidetes bacterium]|nr:MAG: HAMP domain-containing histidine kinase [Bacteroidota bacterium]
MSEMIEISSGLRNFFETMEKFCNTHVHETAVINYIKSCLKDLLEFPSAKFNALYYLSPENFEFELNSVYPEINRDEIKQIFQGMIDSSTLGKSLQTGELSFYKNDIQGTSEHYIICPLIGSKGVIGLIIMKVETAPDDIEFFLVDLLKMFISIISIGLEKCTLTENQTKELEMMDQMVASRTIKLAQSKVQLGEKIETLKSDLTMTMPHEVRTPINQILGFSDYLIKIFAKSEIKDSEDYMEIIKDIHSSAERLKQLFENYLFYARLSIIASNVFEIQNLKKNITPSVQPIIYDRIMMTMIQAVRQDDIKIELSDSPVAMNEEYINKIVEEIIGNCIKYSDPGTGIEVFSFIKDNNYILTFIDHGRGMTAEQIQSIDAYVQFDRRSHEQQGSGLGLSIVQRILDLHEGEFAVESDPGNYTRVMIKLPIPTDYEPEF